MSFNYYGNIPVFGSPADDRTMQQALRVRDTADHVALMADNHLGYSVPIGGVVAYEDAISPSGVGYDIGCGNLALRTDMKADELRDKISTIMDDVWNTISFGVGRKNNERVEHDIFDDALWAEAPIPGLRELAISQLGTVGSGNHYVDLLTDETDHVWVGVHFGSRGFGHKIASHFLKLGGAVDAIDAPPLVLPIDIDLGRDYLRWMELAGEYAAAGRTWVAKRVVKILGANITDSVHNHHNYAWYETHKSQNLWVVRKGATPAFPGQRGFIGGSMADIAVIVRGREPENDRARESQQAALYSTIHGAGRVMSRNQAKKTFTREDLESLLYRKQITLRGGGVDESPWAYKRIEEVLAAHSETIAVEHTLTPIGVAMAGAGEIDPYKD